MKNNFYKIAFLFFLFFSCGKKAERYTIVNTPTLSLSFYKKNIAILSQEIQKHKHPSLYAQRSQLYLHISNLPSSIQDMATAVKMDPENSNYLEKLVELYLLDKNYKAAKEISQQAEKIDTRSYNLYQSIADIHLYEKNYSSALDNISKAIELDSTEYTSYLKRGTIYLFLSDTSNAFANFMKSYQLADGDKSVCLTIAKLCFQLKKYQETASILQKAAHLFSNDPIVLHEAGLFYYSIHRMDSAIYFFNKSLYLDNSYIDNYWYLSSIYFDKKEYYLTAKIIKPILEDSYIIQNPPLFCRLGLAYEKMGNFTESIVTFKKILSLDSTYQEAQIALKRVKTKYINYSINLNRVDTLKRIDVIRKF